MDNPLDHEVIDADLHEQITAVDSANGQPLYPIGKLAAHIDNVPHLAISIFVFDQDRLLLQKRADTKYHSGGLWANTVCSHPRWEESAQLCAERRLQEELGWTTELTEFGLIDYNAQVGKLFENETVHCFAGHIGSDIDVNRFNRSEVAAVEWLTFTQIGLRIDKQPEQFTEWFKIYMAEHVDMLNAVMH